MGKNKNRGDRDGLRRERGPAAPADDKITASAPDSARSAAGFDQQVSRKRQRKFGHN